MNIEDYKQLHDALEITSQGTGYPFRKLLEKSFNEVVRLECEVTRGENRSYMNS